MNFNVIANRNIFVVIVFIGVHFSRILIFFARSGRIALKSTTNYKFAAKITKRFRSSAKKTHRQKKHTAPKYNHKQKQTHKMNIPFELFAYDGFLIIQPQRPSSFSRTQTTICFNSLNFHAKVFQYQIVYKCDVH